MKEEHLAGRRPRALDGKALDAFLVDALARLEVPGAAVAITQHGKVIYEKSLGVRALGREEPVTASTLFLMASVTKPMTTLMEASLVDSGLLSWDTKVTSLMPDFALDDLALTKRLELWHMSCACTGMPRRDLENLFEYANVTPEQRLASMREMKPTTALGGDDEGRVSSSSSWCSTRRSPGQPSRWEATRRTPPSRRPIRRRATCSSA